MKVVLNYRFLNYGCLQPEDIGGGRVAIPGLKMKIVLNKKEPQ